MPDFVYYLPNRAGLRREELKSLGLDYALGEVQELHQRQLTAGGPDGGNGVLVSAASAEVVEHPSAEREWRKLPGNPAGAWLGLRPDARPGPEDLQRAKVHWQNAYYLADGRVWKLPRVLDAAGVPQLPKYYDLDEATGKIIALPRAEFKPLILLAAEVRDAFGSAGVDFTPAREIEIFAAALTLNYRVGTAELMALELTESQSLTVVFAEMVSRFDWENESQTKG